MQLYFHEGFCSKGLIDDSFFQIDHLSGPATAVGISFGGGLVGVRWNADLWDKRRSDRWRKAACEESARAGGASGRAQPTAGARCL